MKPWLVMLAVLGLVRIAAPAQDTNPPPTAQQLLDEVVSQLPREPLDISGDLILRKRRGIELRELKFQMLLKWGDNPATAQYVISDGFGRELEKLTVSREHGKEPVFTYSSGTGRSDEKRPDLVAAIQGTDISWMDLTLSFLWWPGGRIAGNEDVLERPCTVVEVPAPAGQAGAYARVRIWIEERHRMFLKAEGLDANGKSVRVLWVKSFKKINDRWMLKDLEVQASPVHRTKLIVREVNGEKTGLQDEAGDNSSGTVTPIPVLQE